MECLSHYWQNQLAGKSLVTGLALGVACGHGLFVRYVHVSSVDCDDEAGVTQGAARVFSRGCWVFSLHNSYAAFFDCPTGTTGRFAEGKPATPE